MRNLFAVLFILVSSISVAQPPKTTLRTIPFKTAASLDDTLVIQNGTTQTTRLSSVANLLLSGYQTVAGASAIYQVKGNYLTSYTETDPAFLSHVAHSITSTNISNWNSAFGWGNHAGLYPLTQRLLDTAAAIRASFPNNNNQLVNGAGYITGTALSPYLTAANAALAYQPKGNYLTSFAETDPAFIAHVASSITSTNISNWNSAFGWGNHAGLYPPNQRFLDTAAAIRTAIPNNNNQLANGNGYITSAALSPYLTSANASSTYQPAGNYVSASSSYVNPSWITSIPFAKITPTPTTLAGYGITDAGTLAQQQANTTATATKLGFEQSGTYAAISTTRTDLRLVIVATDETASNATNQVYLFNGQTKIGQLLIY